MENELHGVVMLLRSTSLQVKSERYGEVVELSMISGDERVFWGVDCVESTMTADKE